MSTNKEEATSEQAPTAAATNPGHQANEFRWALATVLIIVFLLTVIFVLGSRYWQLQSSKATTTTHIREGSISPMAYATIPPTTGPHYATVADWGIYAEPLRYEQVLHNLEDGGVAIYYQCEEKCPELVTQLEDVVTPYLEAGQKVLLLPNVPGWGPMYNQPYHRDMEARIAVTAWQQLAKYDGLEPTQIQEFIERYEGIDHHP